MERISPGVISELEDSFSEEEELSEDEPFEDFELLSISSS